MAVLSYKCPNCGASLQYKPSINKFGCDYCLSEYSEKELSKLYENTSKTTSTPKINIDPNHLASYNCNSCGATVTTDDTTVATMCYYCHNPVIITNRLVDSFLPDKIIPFTIDKDKAQKTFLRWAKQNRYVPTSFYSLSQLEKITGIYLPYWWTDSVVNVDYEAEVDRTKKWDKGDIQYIETQTYKIIRKGEVIIDNIQQLALSKFDEKLLNGIAPYDEIRAIPFSLAYLSGFFAEQYDIKKETINFKVEDQINTLTKQILMQSISSYNDINIKKDKIQIASKQINYTLLPTWVLTYKFLDKIYVFALNGQTGKAYGELPIDNNKVLATSGLIFIAITVSLLLGGLFIW